MKEPLVYIIILNWNSYNDTMECIDSIRKSSYQNYELLIVDNSSTDNSYAILKRQFSNIKIIKNKINSGYAGGNNRGIKYAINKKAEYIFIINPDSIISETCINELVNKMSEDNSIGMASPKIYYYDKSNIIWYAGSNIDWKRGLTPHIGCNEKDLGQYDLNTYTDRVSGCAVMIKAEILNRTGLFDERYFLYFEETDLSLRFRHYGYKMAYVATAKCWHKISKTTGGYYGSIYQYYMTRNNLLFMKIHCKKKFNEFFVHSIIRSIISILKILKNSKLNKFSIIKSILNGYKDFFQGNYGFQKIKF